MEPEKKEPEEESVKAVITFNLTDGSQEQNVLTIRPSKISDVRESMIKAFESDGKVSLTTQGSVNSPYDFCVIPTKSVVSVSFVVKNFDDDDDDEML